MRVMGVDPGSKRIGLALSDEDRTIASPHSVVEGGTGPAAAHRVAVEAARNEVAKVVVGLPLRLDGSDGDAALRARRLAAHLQAEGLEVVLWDERMSSGAAERALLHGGVRRRARRERIDKVAAALILQSYLDAERERAAD